VGLGQLGQVTRGENYIFWSHRNNNLNALVRKYERIHILECTRGRYIPKKTWDEAINLGLTHVRLMEDIT